MKILILTNFGLGLYKFRKELIEKLLLENNHVVLVYPHDDYVDSFTSLGCNHINIALDRRGKNPFKDLILFKKYYKIIKNQNPDLVLTYTIKPNIYGGLVSRMLKVPYITTITGFGTALEKSGVLYEITKFLYKIGLKRANYIVFQNNSNMILFKKIIKTNNNFVLVRGSGVNLDCFSPMSYPEKDNIIRILFIGRIMKEKGIDELLEVAVKLHELNPNIFIDIIGFCEENYLNILNDLSSKKIVSYYGHQNDIRPFINNCHAVINPSYHEGLSNVLLEAAACCRPVLASNIPGCVETFEEGMSGYSFKPKNSSSIIETINKFYSLSYEDKRNMGLSGRKYVENKFNRDYVINDYLKLIDNIRRK